MQVALLRVGIDTGCGGMHSPLFADGSFEYIPIPDGCNIDERTYSNTTGRIGRKLVEYFPHTRQVKMADQAIHFDPEFATFTYGDPTPPKVSLRRLQPGDLLVFYCGLEGWGDFKSSPALYLLGYFEVQTAGKAGDYPLDELHNVFGANFHVRHPQVYNNQRERLVLVKGSSDSRLLKKAVCISAIGQDRSGRPLKALSPEMQKIFGDFGGKISFQRSPTRWVAPAFTEKAAEFIRTLPDE